MKLLLISLDTELNRNTAKYTDIHITVQGPRSKGGQGGHVPPPPIFLKLYRVSKKKCIVPPPPQYSVMPPSPPVSKLLRGPCFSASETEYIYLWLLHTAEYSYKHRITVGVYSASGILLRWFLFFSNTVEWKKSYKEGK